MTGCIKTLVSINNYKCLNIKRKNKYKRIYKRIYKSIKIKNIYKENIIKNYRRSHLWDLRF